MYKFKNPSIIIAFCLIIASCTKLSEISSLVGNGKKPSTTSVYFFVDITGDEDITHVFDVEHLNEVKKAVGWDEGGYVYNGLHLRAFPIDELSMTRSFDIEMPMADDGINGLPVITRTDDIEVFFKDLSKKLKNYKQKLTKGRDESEIFANLCRQLKELKNETSDRKIVIIYSDMLENSRNFSFYSENVVTQNAIQKAAENCSFPDLSEIEVYIVPPITKENDATISKAESYWREFFASKNTKQFKLDNNLQLD